MISEVRQIRIPQPTVSSGLGDFVSLQSINPSERLNSLYIIKTEERIPLPQNVIKTNH